MVKCWIITLIFIFGGVYTPSVTFASVRPSPIQETIDYAAAIEKLLRDEHSDYLEIKLAIDKLIDPAMNIENTRDKILAMVADLEKMIAPDASEWDKVLKLRKFLYEGGNHRPFSYDLDDPSGKDRRTRLLHSYIETGKGNCVSMPILHVILGQKLGLDMTISTAPMHVFVKYKNKNGKTINIEATSGGHPSRNAWYQKNLPMLRKAVENGMFMKILSNKEAIAVMGHDLSYHLRMEGQYADSILVAEKLIEEYPNYAPLYMSRGSGYWKLVERDYQSKYPNQEDVPEDLRPQLQSWLLQNVNSFEIADRLGWRDPDELKKEIEASSSKAPE